VRFSSPFQRNAECLRYASRSRKPKTRDEKRETEQFRIKYRSRVVEFGVHRARRFRERSDFDAVTRRVSLRIPLRCPQSCKLETVMRVTGKNARNRISEVTAASRASNEHA